jgi:hypothetical protein
MRLGIPRALLLAVLALAGCGDDVSSTSSGAASTAATPTVVETTGGGTVSTGTGATPTGETTGYQIWFTKDGNLAPMWIEGEKTLGVLTEAMKLLLAGPPSGSELETEIPASTEVLDLGFANGTATLDLSLQFAEDSADRVRIGQIVYTLTQYPTVKKVILTVEGKPVPGAPPNPQRPGAAYEEILPAIVVNRPTGLDPVTSPLTVSGTADVFEANVTIKVLDEGGKELASTFTTATCGTGCRGTFAKRVEFDAEQGAKVTLVVQDDDADGDGKPSHEVRVPLEVG